LLCRFRFETQQLPIFPSLLLQSLVSLPVGMDQSPSRKGTGFEQPPERYTDRLSANVRQREKENLDKKNITMTATAK